MSAVNDCLGLGVFDGNELALDGTSATRFMYGRRRAVICRNRGTALLGRNACAEVRYGVPDSQVCKGGFLNASTSERGSCFGHMHRRSLSSPLVRRLTDIIRAINNDLRDTGNAKVR